MASGSSDMARLSLSHVQINGVWPRRKITLKDAKERAAQQLKMFVD